MFMKGTTEQGEIIILVVLALHRRIAVLPSIMHLQDVKTKEANHLQVSDFYENESVKL